MSEFLVTIRPRYGEVDRMGVVYHAHYLSYFEIGRTEFMRSLGTPYAELETRGFRLAVVEAAVRYRRPALYDQELEVAVTLAQVGRATVTFRYELWDAEGAVLSSGHTRLGCMDEDNRPCALPRDVYSRLKAGMKPGTSSSETS